MGKKNLSILPTTLSTTTPKASSSAAQRRMKATRQRDTAAELMLRAALTQLGFRYRVDYPLVGTRRRADIVFVRQRIAVFVDGCFWHGCRQHGTWPKANAEWWREKIFTNRRRDRDTDQKLAAAGWLVLRFWEHHAPVAAAREIKKAFARRCKNDVRR